MTEISEMIIEFKFQINCDKIFKMVSEDEHLVFRCFFILLCYRFGPRKSYPNVIGFTPIKKIHRFLSRIFSVILKS